MWEFHGVYFDSSKRVGTKRNERLRQRTWRAKLCSKINFQFAAVGRNGLRWKEGKRDRTRRNGARVTTSGPGLT